MNILEVTNFFKPSWESGGPARVAYEISKQFVKNGHNVTVFTTDGFKEKLNIDLNKKVIVDGIDVFYFKNYSRYLARKVIPTPLYSPTVIRKNICNYDIVHFHEISPLTAIVYHYAKKSNIPFVVQAHGSMPGLLNTKKSTIEKLTWNLYEREILMNASKLFALTTTESNHYKKLDISDSRISIIFNGFDNNTFQKIKNNGEFKSKFGIDYKNKLILYLGRLNKTKGLDILIESFSYVLKVRNNIVLVIIGPDDNYLDELNKLISRYDLNNNKVKIIGFISEEDKMSAYRDSDVFITPSFSGFPVTFLESIISGTPIITTNKGDILEWLDKKYGFVVDYSPIEIKNAILKIIDSNFSFSFSDRQYFIENFSWDNIARKIELEYSSIIGGGCH